MIRMGERSPTADTSLRANMSSFRGYHAQDLRGSYLKLVLDISGMAHSFVLGTRQTDTV
jgi:hypothetical protein